MHDTEGTAGLPTRDEAGVSAPRLPGAAAAAQPTMTTAVDPPTYAATFASAPQVNASAPQINASAPQIGEPVPASEAAYAAPALFVESSLTTLGGADQRHTAEPEASPAAESPAEAKPPAEEEPDAEEAVVAEPEAVAEASPDWYTQSDTIETEIVEASSTDGTAEPAAEAVLAPADSSTVLPGESILEFRRRMVAVRDQFATATVEAVTQAELVVTDAVAALNQALLDSAVNIGTWRRAEQPDATQLADALRRYRDYLDKVLSL